MAGTLAQSAALAASAGFQARIQAAIVATAVTIAANAPTGGTNTAALRYSLAAQILANSAPHVQKFAQAASVYSSVIADIPASGVPIVSTTPALPSVVTTAYAHNLATGTVVEITRAEDPSLNGTYLATVTDATHFTVPAQGNIFAGPSGVVTAQPTDADITAAVQNSWSFVAGANETTN